MSEARVSYTASPPAMVEAIPLDQLHVDAEYQPRETLSREHVERLRRSDPASWPPLLVAPAEDGGYLVLDGAHRLEAALDLELADGSHGALAMLPCRVVPEADYGLAVRANLDHGLPLSTSDRKVYARWLHTEYPDWSIRHIARECRLAQHTVEAALADEQTAQPADERASAARRFLAHWQKLWATRGLFAAFGARGEREMGVALATEAAARFGDQADVELARLARCVELARTG
jgi:hypothetical protein